MKLKAIVAATENNVIGIDNKMPWHLPDDFKFFKKTTMGFPILMGKNTWISLGRALPGRENIVISKSLKEVDNAILFETIENGLDYLKSRDYDTVFIIGGGTIYKQIFPQLDEIFMTRIHKQIDNGAVFFPEINTAEWNLHWQEYHPKDEKHLFDFTFQHWIRATNES